MPPIVKDVIKAGAVMFAVGVALALIAVPMAQGIQALTGMDFLETAKHHSPLWTGAFFGAFGAIHAALTPLAEAVFSKADPKTPEKEKAKTKEEPAVHIHITQAHDVTQAKSAQFFQEQIAAERNVTPVEKVLIP